MLLDSQLVERFHALHRQRRSVTLSVMSNTMAYRLLMQDGQLAAFDLGMDLQIAIADAAKEHHKLDEEAYALCRTAIVGGQGTAAWMRETSSLSDPEIDLVAQAAVESALLRCFEGPVTGMGVSEEGEQYYDFERRAVRLRIDAEPLLKTLDQRLAERHQIAKEFPTWDVVYGLSEGAGSGTLSDQDKLILNFVDGRTTVEEIASTCRDSSFNLARILRSLELRGVLKRITRHPIPGTTSGASAASRPAVKPSSEVKTVLESVVAAPQPGRAPAQLDDFVPLRQVAADQTDTIGRYVITGGLVVILAVSVGVGVLAYNYQKGVAAQTAIQDEVQAKLARKEWRESLDLLSRLDAQAVNDLSARHRVEEQRQVVEAALATERKQILKLIEATDFTQARNLIAALPTDIATTEVSNQLKAAEERFRQLSEMYVQRVRSRLVANDPVGAYAIMDETEGRESESAGEAIEQWLVQAIDNLRASPMRITPRLTTLALLRSSRPNQRQQELLDAIESDTRAALQKLTERVAELGGIADRGGHALVLAELGKATLADQLHDTPVEAQIAELKARCEKADRELKIAIGDAYGVLASAGTAARLNETAQRVKSALQRFPASASATKLTDIARLLERLAATVERPTAVQGEDLAAILAENATADEESLKAIRVRTVRVRQIEESARSLLEEAKAAAQAGEWEASLAMLDRLMARKEWSGSAARSDAVKELDEVKAKVARRAALANDLNEAVTRGDIAGANAMAREMGLRALPFLIDSTPRGAEILVGGKVIGHTPLVLPDLKPADRPDLQVELRLDGYVPLSTTGAAAISGWHLFNDLERAPLLRFKLKVPATTIPTMAGSELLVASRSELTFAELGDGKVRHYDLTQIASLQEPLYAEPVRDADGFLLLTSRDGLVLRVGATANDRAERLVLPVGSDHAVASHRSQLFVDRRLFVVAGRDGRLVASEPKDSRIRWATAEGANFAMAPSIVGEQVLGVRVDGRLLAISVEDGGEVANANLATPVLAAWSDGGTVRGMTANASFWWDGKGPPVKSDLPFLAESASQGVIVGLSGRIAIADGDEAWRELPRLNAQPTLPPVRWGSGVALALGTRLVVLGEHGFKRQHHSDISMLHVLRPAGGSELLIVGLANGEISAYRR